MKSGMKLSRAVKSICDALNRCTLPLQSTSKRSRVLQPSTSSPSSRSRILKPNFLDLFGELK